jgi:uncharacterized protein (DUF1778 family)
VSNKKRIEPPRKVRPKAAHDVWANNIVLDEMRWREFVKALASPPKENSKLRNLLARRPAWES